MNSGDTRIERSTRRSWRPCESGAAFDSWFCKRPFGGKAMRRHTLVILGLGVVLLFGAAPAVAQRTTATFTGLVVDTSGGVAARRDVALTNAATGIVERQVSDGTASSSSTTCRAAPTR